MNDISRRAIKTANLLRLTQASLADESAGARQSYLNELIEKEVSPLAGDERARFLAELDAQFPIFQNDAPASGAAEPPLPTRPLTAEELTSDLLSRKPDVRKAVLEALLKAEGAAPRTETPALPADIEQAAGELMKKTGLKELDFVRACELMGLLTSFIGLVDQMAWNTWRQVAPSSSLKRTVDLPAEIRKFLSGDATVSLDLVKQELDKARKLLAALSASLGHLTHHLAHEHFARIAPEEIENLVGVEGGGLLTSREVKCWRKYVELAETFTEARLEQEIKASVAKYVESLVKVPGR